MMTSTGEQTSARIQYSIHLVVFFLYVYVLCYDFHYVADENGHAFLHYHGYSGKLKYLTAWNMILQTVYFAVCVLNDVTGTNVKPWEDQRRRSGLQRLRDLLMTGLIFPLAVLVSLSFWGIYAVDRELIYPKKLDALIPVWLNHFMHTFILVWVILDRLVTYHHPPSRKQGITLMVFIAILYQAWIFWVAFYADIWVYPILKVLSWPSRALFLVGLSVALAPIYFLGEEMTAMIWGSPKLPRNKKNK